MEHPDIPIVHYDDVPRSLAREITTWADLTWHFGPRGDGFLGQDLSKVAAQKLGMRVPDLQTASRQQETLEEDILNWVAGQGSHTLLVLQVHPNPIEGFVCLIPNTHLERVEQLLCQVPIKRR